MHLFLSEFEKEKQQEGSLGLPTPIIQTSDDILFSKNSLTYNEIVKKLPEISKEKLLLIIILIFIA
jgi:hypothetical protein